LYVEPGSRFKAENARSFADKETREAGIQTGCLQEAAKLINIHLILAWQICCTNSL